MKIRNKQIKRLRRHKRITSKLKSGGRLRLAVYRSSRYLQLQLIDDLKHKTLFGFSDLKVKKGTKQERAIELGKLAAKKITDEGFKKVVFDRGGYQYHGRIKSLAESLRKGGLEF